MIMVGNSNTTFVKVKMYINEKRKEDVNKFKYNSC